MKDREESSAAVELREEHAKDLLASLVAVIGILDRIGGYLTHHDQETLRTARAALVEENT